eukprot:scaffold6397_cov121-Isochrysis_galbana.AAC.6
MLRANADSPNTHYNTSRLLLLFVAFSFSFSPPEFRSWLFRPFIGVRMMPLAELYAMPAGRSGHYSCSVARQVWARLR